jgi:hypothetical protein
MSTIKMVSFGGFPAVLDAMPTKNVSLSVKFYLKSAMTANQVLIILI